MKYPDAIVIGAGIVGASCAWALARAGVGVQVIESGTTGGGATAGGMGHLVVMDDSEAEFALTRYSRARWLELANEMPDACEFRRFGTIWVAADEEELDAVRRKHAWYGERDVATEILDSRALAEAEPNLRSGLAGGLLVPDDAVIYAPAAARWLLERALAKGAVLTNGEVVKLEGSGARLASGDTFACGTVIVANGCAAMQLFADLPMRPRKGHLAISERYPGFVNHQLIELGYLKSAHGAAAESVAFNAQPRPTGQILLGSSRQFDDTAGVDNLILSRMLGRAVEYMPDLRQLAVIRVWTGFRAATPDRLPLIGPYEADDFLLATGHEGLGITTSLATGELIASMVTGSLAPLAPDAFLPARYALERAHA
ncbi:MAG TPA: FAD-dependent oxidoreductase [Bryobacteraceae bacterium]